MRKLSEIPTYDYKHLVNDLAPSAMFYRKHSCHIYMRLNNPQNDLVLQVVDLTDGRLVNVQPNEEVAFAGFVCGS